ncbi:Predicted AAA-ATPase [Succinivibrio dextrinosolvens]|uniref:Predicted AAA-ATPase n=1 Tax=Succinivibrio dextrinosolvens TaxID=83771 RepID=A0A662ZGK6_9GAMM|nr:Predicted AAA-ATPase [Succinivibrio dextrinosolvens]
MGPTILQDEDFDRIPLSTTRFSELRALNQIYVDKTLLIYKIARQRSPVYLTRPSRFGKSLLLSTFDSLFSKGLEDFKGLSIKNSGQKTKPIRWQSFPLLITEYLPLQILMRISVRA